MDFLRQMMFIQLGCHSTECNAFMRNWKWNCNYILNNNRFDGNGKIGSSPSTGSRWTIGRGWDGHSENPLGLDESRNTFYDVSIWCQNVCSKLWTLRIDRRPKAVDRQRFRFLLNYSQCQKQNIRLWLFRHTKWRKSVIYDGIGAEHHERKR